MTTNKTATFAIIANVAFNIPRPMLGAFNKHHAQRLVKTGGSMGKVTEEGVKFFSDRTRTSHEDMLIALKAEGYEMHETHPWAYKNNVPYVAGNGINGKSVFVWALSALTQAAQKASIAAETKAAKAQTTPIKRVRAAKAKPAVVTVTA